jgi:hypothetical protein
MELCQEFFLYNVVPHRIKEHIDLSKGLGSCYRRHGIEKRDDRWDQGAIFDTKCLKVCGNVKNI